MDHLVPDHPQPIPTAMDGVLAGLLAGGLGLTGFVIDQRLGVWVGLAAGGLIGGALLGRLRLLAGMLLGSTVPPLLVAAAIPKATCFAPFGVALFLVFAACAAVIVPLLGFVGIRFGRQMRPLTKRAAIAVVEFGGVASLIGWAWYAFPVLERRTC